MAVTIEELDKNLEICEKVKRETPQYYEQHWKDKHEVLLKIRKELENKK